MFVSQVIDPDETFSCNMPSLGVTGGGYVKNRIHNRLRLELFDTSPRGIDKDFLLDNGWVWYMANYFSILVS